MRVERARELMIGLFQNGSIDFFGRSFFPRRFTQRLGQGRMGVHRPREVLGGGAELHRHYRFGNEIRRARARYVNAKYTVALGVGNDFDQPFSLI